jgi:hypothetical protein
MVLLLCPGVAQAGSRLALRHVALDLPGPPSKVIHVDLDRDGREDLVVVVGYTEIEDIGGARIENLIQIATVIPALFSRREVRAYLATADGSYRLAGEPFALADSVLHMERGPAGLPIVALTDDGLAELRFDRATGEMQLTPLLSHAPVLAGTRSFYASLELVHELNGDGTTDFLLPAEEGLAVYLGTNAGLATEPADVIALPSKGGNGRRRDYPLPEIREIDGDGVPDLVFSSDNFLGSLNGGQGDRLRIMLGSAEGRFRPLRSDALDCHDDGSDLRIAAGDPPASPWPDNLVDLLDLDGDGRAEAIISLEMPRGDSFRKEMKDAKKPIQRYSFHRLDDGLFVERSPYHTTEVLGHAFEIEEDEELPISVEHLVDLDGDGRTDLVTVTLDFSMWQVFKILATKKIGVGLDFHVYRQHQDGSFRKVEGLELSDKLKFDLNDLKIGRIAQFAGDFDGDGRQDFVHLGKGREITIHTGGPGCEYPKKPDYSVRLDEAPGSIDLVRIEDIDADGRADIRITRPLKQTDVDTTAPVRLDLYLSGGAS